MQQQIASPRKGQPNIRFARYDRRLVRIHHAGAPNAMPRDYVIRFGCSSPRTVVSSYRWKRLASPTSATASSSSAFTCNLELVNTGGTCQKIRVPRKALSNVVRRLHEAMRWQPLQESGAARLVRGSAVVRGWSNYYNVAFNFSKAANWLDTKHSGSPPKLCATSSTSAQPNAFASIAVARIKSASTTSMC